MYKVVFKFPNGYGYHCETYGGGFYRMNGEKYAVFDNISPKLYKSEKSADKAARVIAETCINGTWLYEIVSVHDN